MYPQQVRQLTRQEVSLCQVINRHASVLYAINPLLLKEISQIRNAVAIAAQAPFGKKLDQLDNAASAKTILR